MKSFIPRVAPRFLFKSGVRGLGRIAIFPFLNLVFYVVAAIPRQTNDAPHRDAHRQIKPGAKSTRLSNHVYADHITKFSGMEWFHMCWSPWRFGESVRPPSEINKNLNNIIGLLPQVMVPVGIRRIRSPPAKSVRIWITSLTIVSLGVHRIRHGITESRVDAHWPGIRPPRCPGGFMKLPCV